MNAYYLTEKDQPRNIWLIFDEQPDPPYVVLRERYRPLRCPTCGLFDHECAFKEGFEPRMKLLPRGDFFRSSEGFLCVNEKFRALVESSSVRGLEFKPVPEQPWFVVNIVRRVKADPAVYDLGKRFCATCHRPKELTGLIEYLSQIEVPAEGQTFFSPVFDRKGNRNADRDAFATEDVVMLLKQKSIKGGYFTRLLDAKEEARIKARIAAGQLFKLPKGALVEL